MPMSKKTPVTKKRSADAADRSQDFIAAIATVKQLQDFIKEHGSLEHAQAAAVRVHRLIEMAGGFDRLRQALDIVGQEPTPPHEEQSSHV
jgi:hypothetical protein